MNSSQYYPSMKTECICILYMTCTEFVAPTANATTHRTTTTTTITKFVQRVGIGAIRPKYRKKRIRNASKILRLSYHRQRPTRRTIQIHSSVNKQKSGEEKNSNPKSIRNRVSQFNNFSDFFCVKSAIHDEIQYD